MSWSHKQQVVSLSSVEAEYKAIIQASYKMLWVSSPLIELGFLVLGPMPMFCDNKAALLIANNLTFHDHTKHTEIDSLLFDIGSILA